MGTPDLIEPVVGWRRWRMVQYKHPKGPWPNPTPHDEGRFRLMSPLTRVSMWRPGEALKALCNRQGIHDSPEVDCGCGVYALKQRPDLSLALDFLKPGMDKTPIVIGEVSLWGKVIEHERGFRGEYAYPRRLLLLLPEAWPGPKDADPWWGVIHHDLSAYRVPIEFLCIEVKLRPPLWDPLAPPHGAG